MNLRRFTKSTSIAGGEGKTEEVFLKYLKQIYLKGDYEHSIHIPTTTNGGDPICVAKKIMNTLQNRTADAILIFLDNDRAKGYSCETIIMSAKKKCPLAIRQKVPCLSKCIKTFPCTEGLLLRITGHKIYSDSSLCKEKFEKIFKKNAAQFRDIDYAKYFPKNILDNKRSEILELDELIKYFEIATKVEFINYFGR